MPGLLLCSGSCFPCPCGMLGRLWSCQTLSCHQCWGSWGLLVGSGLPGGQVWTTSAVLRSLDTLLPAATSELARVSRREITANSDHLCLETSPEVACWPLLVCLLLLFSLGSWREPWFSAPFHKWPPAFRGDRSQVLRGRSSTAAIGPGTVSWGPLEPQFPMLTSGPCPACVSFCFMGLLVLEALPRALAGASQGHVGPTENPWGLSPHQAGTGACIHQVLSCFSVLPEGSWALWDGDGLGCGPGGAGRHGYHWTRWCDMPASSLCGQGGAMCPAHLPRPRDGMVLMRASCVRPCRAHWTLTVLGV